MIDYDKKEYDGVLITPIYINDLNYIYPQMKEFATILIESLVNDFAFPMNNKAVSFSVEHVKDKIFIATVDLGGTIKKYIYLLNSITYLLPNDIIFINNSAQKMFEEEGIYGVCGIREYGLLSQLADSVDKNSIMFGIDKYPTIISKAAHLWYILARYQIFANGNKRTGLLVALIFLKWNFLVLKSKKLSKMSLYNISLKIANNEIDEKYLQDFIHKNFTLDFSRMKQIYAKFYKNKTKD